MLSSVMKTYLKATTRWPSFFRFLSGILKKPLLLLLDLISMLRGFTLPRDSYLPPHKITMILGIYESDTVQLCKKLIKPGMVVLDGGAHAGYFTRLFSTYAGSTGTVIAVEPHPDNVTILGKNLAAKNYSNVRIVEKALGSSTGSATLYESEGSVGHSLHPAPFRGGGKEVAVDSIDNILASQGLSKADFVKLDVEGNEVAALEGMQQTLRNSPDIALVLEYRKDNVHLTAKTLYEKLHLAGMRIYLIGEGPPVEAKSPVVIEKHSKCNILATRRQPHSS